MKKNFFRCFILLILSSISLVGLRQPSFAASNGICVTPTQSSLSDSGTTYIVQTFTTVESNCTYAVPAGVTSIEAVVVGGGGGAGFGACGGGGGAGRVIVSNSGLSVTSGSNLTLTIGGGGVGGWNAIDTAWRSGISGAASSLTVSGNLYSATGGGGGGGGSGSGTQGFSGLTGGSGGGGTSCGTVGSGGTATSSAVSGFTTYGFNGGAGVSAQGGGGGGGAGGLGASGTTRAGGAGIIRWGVTLAGGGGGWASGSGGSSIGGSAGTGFDTKANAGNPGAAGTGSGGGGGNDGGSGRIMIRYVPDTTAPTITGPSSATGLTSSISIAENSTAVHTFTANETVTWSKSGTDESFFAISTGGVLTITARDFESAADNGANNTYIVAVRATDTAGNATTQTLTVTITNVNEAPRITTASSAETHSISIAENTTSVLTYAGSDTDTASSLTWSISGTDSSFFAINSSSGVLTITARDFEAPADADTNNTYIVIVTLSDGSLTDGQTLTVTITNANESASINAPTISGAINKGITTTISVTVNAAGKVRFFVGGKRINNCLARTTSGSYPTFTATCTWRPAVTGRQSLTATVTPTNNTFSASTSARSEVFVLKRTGTR